MLGLRGSSDPLWPKPPAVYQNVHVSGGLINSVTNRLQFLQFLVLHSTFPNDVITHLLKTHSFISQALRNL